MVKSYRKCSNVARSPKRPFEKVRLEQEMSLIATYGLKNKRECWRVGYSLGKIRAAARHLLTLDPKDPVRIFQGAALLRRMLRLGLLSETEDGLDYVLGLTPKKIMERRLQTKVFKLGLARSIHHARVMILQRHVMVGRQMVNVPSFLVRVDAEKHIKLSPKSRIGGGGTPGRKAKQTLRESDKKKSEEGEDE
eukprot:Selendium_serpulae@DN4259_c0_g1_i3.p1